MEIDEYKQRLKERGMSDELIHEIFDEIENLNHNDLIKLDLKMSILIMPVNGECMREIKTEYRKRRIKWLKKQSSKTLIEMISKQIFDNIMTSFQYMLLDEGLTLWTELAENLSGVDITKLQNNTGN